MGNAITNPGRFIEKKIMHEQFGVPDPKQPHKTEKAQACANQCFDLHNNTYSYTDKHRDWKMMGDTFAYAHCNRTCQKK